jgi:Cu+-exporting ATPase
LALATPIASIVGVAVGAKKGVIFKASSAIEKLAKASLLFVDKTGTLTIGRPQVIKNIKLSQYDPKILATLVSGSNHPIAKAIKEHIGDIGDKDIVNTEELKARGLSATIESKNVIGGNAIFLHESGVEVPKEYESAGFLLAMDGVLCEAFWLKDKVRADSKEALARIRAIGVEVVMLTGDNEQSAREIAEELAITSYYHSLKPDDKLSHIQIAQEDGKIVVMSGDGINDTLALARADVSVSLSSASDVSIMTADVILLNSNMSGLADAFVIGKKTYNVIKQNIGFSLVYNLITVPVAIAGFVIPPVAAASMSLSSIIVVLNSIRLKGKVI